VKLPASLRKRGEERRGKQKSKGKTIGKRGEKRKHPPNKGVTVMFQKKTSTVKKENPHEEQRRGEVFKKRPSYETI